MNVIVIKDYSEDLRRGEIIEEVRETPNHYSGMHTSSSGTRFVRIHKSYCEPINPIKHAKRK